MGCCNTIKLSSQGSVGPVGNIGLQGLAGDAGADGADGADGGVEVFQVLKLAKNFTVTNYAKQSPLTITLAELQSAGMLQSSWVVDQSNWDLNGNSLVDFGIQIWVRRGSSTYDDAMLNGTASNISYNSNLDRIEFDVSEGSVSEPRYYRVIIVG